MAYLLHERKSFYTAVILFFCGQLEEQIRQNIQHRQLCGVILCIFIFIFFSLLGDYLLFLSRQSRFNA